MVCVSLLIYPPTSSCFICAKGVTPSLVMSYLDCTKKRILTFVHHRDPYCCWPLCTRFSSCRLQVSFISRALCHQLHLRKKPCKTSFSIHSIVRTPWADVSFIICTLRTSSSWFWRSRQLRSFWGARGSSSTHRYYPGQPEAFWSGVKTICLDVSLIFLIPYWLRKSMKPPI